MRLFIGVAIPQPLRDEVGERIAALRRRLPAARWVAAEKLHLTLSFLGETEEAALPTLSAALQEVFARHVPFELQIAGAGWFPPGRGARVLWLGLENGRALEKLQSGVAEQLAAGLGMEWERRSYHAHLTVARCSRPWPRRAAESWVGAFPSRLGEPFEVEAGHLFRSRLGRGGATYEILQSFALQDG